MLDALDRFVIPFSVHKVVPFVGDLEPEPAPVSDDVICIGSYAMRHYAKRRGWNPGVFDLEPHTFERQRDHWGAAMLNADSEIMPFGDARFDGLKFVRPVDDTKAFAGGLFEWDEFAKWQHGVATLGENVGNSLTSETIVQVSSPKMIFQEVRCWVVDGRVITASVYRRASRVIYSSEVEPRLIEFANRLADLWSPERAFCLDVCDTPGGLRVVEINTINSAGFYAADMQKLVASLDGLRR
ncbi:MAG: DUF4343 domain-containing protein [Hyphomicrobiales bacterium]|nr:MAG: DUF4343 domain-containing protein [Hyphomicrobiales bacterium]